MLSHLFNIMARHIETGIIGEEKALRFLKEMGYSIVEKNWKSRKGEIDIVAIDGSYLVIIEVKTKRSRLFGNPEQAVDWQKQKKIIGLAEEYIKKNKIQLETRFDIVSVLLEGKSSRIIHHINAFSPFD